MRIQFYDDPIREPLPRDDVRINHLGLYVYEDGRRVAIGFDITPFVERPSLQVTVTNALGQEAGSLTVIEATQPNFHLTMHLRDPEPTAIYTVEAILYYSSPSSARSVVHRITKELHVSSHGEQ